jgi:predicted site-specific integrase-resolvase
MTKKLHSIQAGAECLGISKFTLRRLTDAGLIRSITISSPRLIPEEEIERVAREGAGKPRRRRAGEGVAPTPARGGGVLHG